MKQITLTIPGEPQTRLIPVNSEKIDNDTHPREIKEIKDKETGIVWAVYDYYLIDKSVDEMFPVGMFVLATGMILEAKDILYNKTYLFICKKKT